jgi:hypothetical protein
MREALSATLKRIVSAQFHPSFHPSFVLASRLYDNPMRQLERSPRSLL